MFPIAALTATRESGEENSVDLLMCFSSTGRKKYLNICFFVLGAVELLIPFSSVNWARVWRRKKIRTCCHWLLG